MLGLVMSDRGQTRRLDPKLSRIVCQLESEVNPFRLEALRSHACCEATMVRANDESLQELHKTRRKPKSACQNPCSLQFNLEFSLTKAILMLVNYINSMMFSLFCGLPIKRFLRLAFVHAG
ncbi:MAG TPA: hypothetical protein DCE18_16185 [Syntrophobacteraceae bacterium]|nr:hypothetical protein [Syntrophobacteraceae bacterium]HBZ57095.1 hypothetical protein [Syntrophobacteraceae bacterium]